MSLGSEKEGKALFQKKIQRKTLKQILPESMWDMLKGYNFIYRRGHNGEDFCTFLGAEVNLT